MLKNKRHFLNWIKENGTLLPIKEKWYILNWIKANNKFNKEYQRVSYIENIDGAYTIIDYNLKGNTEVDLKMKFTDQSRIGSGVFGNNTSIGTGTKENPKFMITTTSSGETLSFYYNNLAIQAIRPSANIGNLTRVQTKVEDGKLHIYLNEELITVPNYSVANFSCKQGTLLFGLQGRIKSQRIYSCKFSEAGELKVNLVPCYRKSDGEIGLYDKVNDKFYTKAGSGEFIKGGNK